MSDLPVISPISPVTPAVLPQQHASMNTAAAASASSEGARGGGGGAGGTGGAGEAAHGLFNNPIVHRHGGPMDMIDQSDSEMGYNQNRPPLRSQLSNKSGCSSSSQSQQSFVSAASSLSDQSTFSSNNNIHIQHTPPPNPSLLQPQQEQHPALYPSQLSGPTISPTLTTASGHLAPPPPEKSKSRRWSLTGRFFDKRKSITEPFHIPSNLSQPPLNLATSYNSNNSNIVHGANGESQEKGERTSNGYSNSDSDSPTTPPSSNGGSRRSSIADIPKAFLSSLRRVSLSGPPSMAGPSSNNGVTSAQASGLLSAGVDETDRRRSDQSDSSEKAAWLGEKPLITMAVLKAPPQDPLALSRRPPPKSILKRRPSDLNANALGGPGMVTSAALAGAGVSKTAGNAGDAAGPTANEAGAAPPTGPVPLDGAPRRLSALASEDIHPMASPDMDIDTIKLLASSADHRARLVTNSPPPSRPHDEDHPLSPVAPAESNLHKGRGGERAQGAVGPDDMSQDELLTHQMLTLSARAQGLAQQYYGPGSGGHGSIQGGLGGGQSIGAGGGHGGLIVPGSGGQEGGPKRRSINFLDRIEIIPAYRKSDYNRSSDKHATFRILTPDLKSEIRDELNTYKMREMAVHVESMGNTAFH
ncbi:hypothetical protein BGZ72_003370 [Mortierella alpina]|nr:hypothetical protein BGZ72_003370 [Mortierella alpina]